MVSDTRPPPRRAGTAECVFADSEDGRSYVMKCTVAERRTVPLKCPSCGSREWTPHAGKEVCAYCRSDRA